MMTKVLTAEELRRVPRARSVWVEYYDGELGRSTTLMAAMKCKDGSLVDEDTNVYTDFEKDMTPDAENNCWRFWNRKPKPEERKRTRWEI